VLAMQSAGARDLGLDRALVVKIFRDVFALARASQHEARRPERRLWRRRRHRRRSR
jgi:hypothetical protein